MRFKKTEKKRLCLTNLSLKFQSFFFLVLGLTEMKLTPGQCKEWNQDFPQQPFCAFEAKFMKVAVEKILKKDNPLSYSVPPLLHTVKHQKNLLLSPNLLYKVCCCFLTHL